MKTDCKTIRERLADLADGLEPEGVRDHLQECASCRKEYAVLVKMVSAARKPLFEPSEEAIKRAIALMPAQPVKVARLVLGQLGLVRSSGTEEFQLVFETDDLHARLMYQPGREGWSVTGRIDGPVKSLQGATSPIALEEGGRFRFDVQNLADSDLYIDLGESQVKIPAATDVTSNGSE